MLFPFSGWPLDGPPGCLDACVLIAFSFFHILYTPLLMAIVCSALSLSLFSPFLSFPWNWTLVHWT